MGFTKTYFDYQRKYEEKYGDSIVVFIRKGKFYECYQYIENLEGKHITIEGNAQLKFKKNSDYSIGKAVEISLLLNMKLTSTDKNKPHTINNPLMVGFPPPNYDQHKDIVLMHGYTIVRIEQVDNGTKDVEREVAEIISPGTELNTPSMDYQPTRTNSIISIYFELKRIPKNKPESAQVLCGISCIDVSTGESTIYEVYSNDNNDAYVIQEIYRFLCANRPVDIIVHIVGKEELSKKYLKYLNEQLNLDKYPTKVVKCNQLDNNFTSDNYQEAVFNKAFGNNHIQQGTTNYIYQLDLELFEYGRISYVVLLQYCYEHNEMLIKRLQKPNVGWTDQNKYLILTYDAAQQLDFFPNNNNPLSRNCNSVDSLISVLDMTSTLMGSRYLRRSLLNPITDIERLQNFYDMTEELLDSENIFQDIDLYLKQLPDIERLQRKIQMDIIKPTEIVSLFTGYDIIEQIYILLFKQCFREQDPKISLRKLLLSDDYINDFNDILNTFRNMIDFTKLKQSKLYILHKKQYLECSDSFINTGYYPHIDNIQDKLNQNNKWLQMIIDHLNNMLLNSRGKGIECTVDRQDGRIIQISLSTTTAKANKLKNSTYNSELCGNLQSHSNRSRATITSDIIEKIINQIIQCRHQLEENLLIIYNTFVSTLSERTYFKELNRFISELDFIKTNSQLAIKYRYFKPIINSDASEAFFNIVNGRHPLVERIISMEYIPNDIKLDNGDNPLGLLLYGFNSAGKSCFAKMVATIINMAQTGLYVPAQLTYHPFTKIITRLTGQDNLIKGKSSFVVEATEIRTILRNADNNTLVLGDELCSTTETDSGTSIAAVTIDEMIKRNTKFIFATHMHHLPKVNLINENISLGKLRVAHLTATYDEVEEKLMYNRKIVDGPGSSQYGLEVCKSLGFDRKFLDTANLIRREIEQAPTLFMNTKKSRYNARVYIDKCTLCNTHIDLHTHHLKEQSMADDNGYISHHHKNSSYNLVVLCSNCHKKIHKIKNLSTIQTLEGVHLKC